MTTPNLNFKNAEAMFELLLRVERSCCLKQVVSGKCICFSCEARDLIAKVKGKETSGFEVIGADGKRVIL